MNHTLYYPTGNPDANIHYETLSDRRKHSYKNQEPKTGRGSTGTILEKQVGIGIIINTDGKPIDNRNKLCSRN